MPSLATLSTIDFPFKADLYTFQEQNAEYIRISLEYSIKAIEECISSAHIKKEEIFWLTKANCIIIE